MHVPSYKPCDRVAVILPVLWVVSLRNGLKLRWTNEDVGVEDYSSDRDEADHRIVVEHVFELVVLPSGNKAINYKWKFLGVNRPAIGLVSKRKIHVTNLLVAKYLQSKLVHVTCEDHALITDSVF